MSPEDKGGREVTRGWAGPAQWFHQTRRRVQDRRGMALIMTLFVVFTLGMMIFAFAFMMQGEASFAALNRNTSVALSLAEAGVQEAVYRLGSFGKGPGVSSFPNSLANSTQSPGSTGTVTFQAPLANNPQIFPVTSTATFGGTTRTVRLFEQAIYKPGSGNIVFGPQVTFGGNAHQITGDSYALTFITYQQFQKSPMCSSALVTPTNLLSPQVFAGTYVGAGSGPNQTAPCGDTNAGTQYNSECATALNEVAPTPCPGGRLLVGGYTLPQNWHPMTPIGMGSFDFTSAAAWINSNPGLAASYGLSVTRAQQNAVDVPYNPASYSPTYWGSIPGSSNRVLLVNAQLPFCVNTGAGRDVKQPIPLYGGPCPAGYNLYGPPATGQADRYLDWGLVQDDLSRTIPQTFFQTPACTAPRSSGQPKRDPLHPVGARDRRPRAGLRPK